MEFIAGFTGGAAGVLAGHPLDTVKVRLQTQTGVYRGTWHCLMMIVKKEHVKGLYKGMSSPLASLTLINAIVFGVHGNVVKKMNNEQSILTHFAAGAAAGAAQGVVAAPTELLKLRIQLQADDAHAKYKSPFHCMKTIVHEQGWRFLGRGMLATQLRDCPAFGIYFASYEYMARKMSKDGSMEALTSTQLLLAGGGAGMLSWLFNYPTDVVKTRFQASDTAKSYAEIIRLTYAERGLRTFFVGLGSTLLRAFPSNAATFFTVEWTYRLLLDFKILDKALDLESHSHKYTAGSSTNAIVANEHHHQHHPPRNERYVSVYDLWNRNSFLLPEAGSTNIDPMIHGCRFL
uniref:Mitochondrial basic amino acids transporter n=1 Tax=Panagrellus redivivus TaxID=6233 RepID=A0A7E4VYD2_PANRE